MGDVWWKNSCINQIYVRNQLQTKWFQEIANEWQLQVKEKKIAIENAQFFESECNQLVGVSLGQQLLASSGSLSMRESLSSSSSLAPTLSAAARRLSASSVSGDSARRDAGDQQDRGGGTALPLQEDSLLPKPRAGVAATTMDQARLTKLQSDLTAAYKRNATNAENLLALNEQLRSLKQAVRERDETLEVWQDRAARADDNARALRDALGERDTTIHVLRDELHALQLELLKSEEKAKSLAAENGQLVERWLRKANEDASKLNEANLFYEELRQAAGQTQVLNAASAEPQVNVGGQSQQHQHQHQQQSATGTTTSGSTTNESSSSSLSSCPTSSRRAVDGAHPGGVAAMAFHPSGTVYASAGFDKTVKLWDAASDQLRGRLVGATQAVSSVTFSGNGDLVLGASNDHAARLWHVQHERVRHTLTGHVGKVYSASFSPDSKRVITGSADRTLKLWDLSKGFCAKTIFCFSSCNSVCFTRDSAALVSGHFDASVRFWSAVRGDSIKELRGLHTGQVTHVEAVAGGRTVLTASRDHTLRLVDVVTHEPVVTLSDPSYQSTVNWAKPSIASDGLLVAAGGADGSVFAWDLRKPSAAAICLPSSPHQSGVVCCAWHPKSMSELITGDRSGLISHWV